jgi:hypothetical protein
MDQPLLSAQDADLRRVHCKLGKAILDFCSNRRTFHLADLQLYLQNLGITHAPSSPDRILRLLRAGGKVNYKVIDRSKSLYEVTQ